jgi:hypothetical protein
MIRRFLPLNSQRRDFDVISNGKLLALFELKADMDTQSAVGQLFWNGRAAAASAKLCPSSAA